MIIDRLIEKIAEKKNPTALGLDTSAEYLPDELKAGITSVKDIAKKVFEFNKTLIDETAELVPAVKLQSAYYEMYGKYGAEALSKTAAYAKKRGLITIGDVKRNDIASTAAAYSKAYLSAPDIGGKPLYDFDFITVNPYLGSDGITPFSEDCKSYDKGLFILVKTSNKSSSELQNRALDDGRKVYELISDEVCKWGLELIGKYGYSAIGAVVGATHRAEAELLRKRHKSLFFLVPGYGAQGAGAEDLKAAFDSNGRGAIVNNSRGIICAHKRYSELKYYEAAKKAVLAMKEDICGVLF